MAIVASEIHRQHLSRLIRRALRVGVPLVVIGPAAMVFAIWLGLDFTGDLLLGLGVVLALIGLVLVGTGIASMFALVEAAWTARRTRRRARKRAKPSPDAGEREPSGANPLTSPDSSVARAPDQGDRPPPHIF